MIAIVKRFHSLEVEQGAYSRSLSKKGSRGALLKASAGIPYLKTSETTSVVKKRNHSVM